MITCITGHHTVVFVLVHILGHEIRVEVVQPQFEEVDDTQAFTALCQKIKAVKLFPNNEVDLLVETYPRSSIWWSREATIRIPENYMPRLLELFGEEVELTSTEKNAVLYYLVELHK